MCGGNDDPTGRTFQCGQGPVERDERLGGIDRRKVAEYRGDGLTLTSAGYGAAELEARVLSDQAQQLARDVAGASQQDNG